jgi:hypothetical protein
MKGLRIRSIAALQKMIGAILRAEPEQRKALNRAGRVICFASCEGCTLQGEFGPEGH